MKKLLFFLIAALVTLGSLTFVQLTFAQTQNAGVTDFASYCASRCTLSLGEDQCGSLCIGTGDTFKGACNSICIEKGSSSTICDFGCALAEKKRDSIKTCFDPCIKTNSTDSCETNCDVKTLFSQLKIAVSSVGNTSQITVQKIAAISEIIGISKEAIAETALGRNITITAGKISISEVDGKRIIKIPVNLTEGERLKRLEDRTNGVTIEDGTIELPVQSKAGQKTARIVMETEGIVGKDGNGEAIINKMTLKTEEIRAEFKAAIKEELKAALKETKVTIDADLKNLPENVTVDIKSSDVPEQKLLKFKELAQKANLSIKEKAVAIEVTKENLKNVEDVGRAKIKIKIDKAWIDSIGGATKARIMREDSGNYEILSTTAVGEENGLVVFEGDSPNGLSLYALVTVEPLSPTGTTTGAEGEQKKLPVDLILGGTVVIVIIAAIAFYFFGKKKPSSGSGKK